MDRCSGVDRTVLGDGVSGGIGTRGNQSLHVANISASRGVVKLELSAAMWVIGPKRMCKPADGNANDDHQESFEKAGKHGRYEESLSVMGQRNGTGNLRPNTQQVGAGLDDTVTCRDSNNAEKTLGYQRLICRVFVRP